MNTPVAKRYTTMFGGKELVIETGKYAKLVSGSVIVRYEETVLLVTAQMSDGKSPMNFLPLTVEFEEKHYAIGKIPGSFQRREGRPGTRAILNARITDRQIRPLFPKTLRNEVQVIVSVLSADQKNDPGVLGAIGASAALSISDIPWEGPTGCVRVGFINNKYVINPTAQELQDSPLDLLVAGTQDAILMVEAGADELSEDVMVGGFDVAQEAISAICGLIAEMQKDIGKEKSDFEPDLEISDEDVAAVYDEAIASGLRDAILVTEKKARGKAAKEVRQKILDARVPDVEADGAAEQIEIVKGAFDKALQKESRRLILEENLRADSRKVDEIRPIWIEVGILPQAHGSAVFTRGETQVLGVATLGTGKDNRLVDDLTLEDSEEFMLHYNFPPYSTGEVKRLGGVSRREQGHGNLARRSLERMIPNQEKFPYVIRVVAETLESNGSSSMASVCAASLSLMDAGVPIRKPVAGIAMGLVKEGENYKILSDILGSEDALGDMDFKVTGTKEGVTALQMDMKIKGITAEIMQQALQQARAGRLHILGLMEEVLATPRNDVSERAPRIVNVRIPQEKIGAVIGPGGKQIRELEAMGVSVDIAEDGLVSIYSEDAQAAAQVKEKIEQLTATAKVGDVYEGRVAKIMDFGAFITLFPGTDGLLHISQIAEERVEDVHDYFSEGDKVKVKIVSIDDRGKIDLCRPELEGKVASRDSKRSRGGGGHGGGNFGRGGRDNRGGGRGRR